MSERPPPPSENAPPDEAAEQMRAIAARARRASSQTIELAALCAYEVLAFHRDDEGAATKRIRLCLDKAVDASARWHSEQLATLAADLARERERADAAEANAKREGRVMRMAVLRYTRGEITLARLSAIMGGGT